MLDQHWGSDIGMLLEKHWISDIFDYGWNQLGFVHKYDVFVRYSASVGRTILGQYQFLQYCNNTSALTQMQTMLRTLICLDSTFFLFIQ